MEIFPSLDAFEAASGRELGPTDWLEIQQDRIDKFADATDDYQWIHVDPVRAADGPFGRTIAHGLLTLSLLPHFMEQLYRVDGVSMAINYGLNKVRFLSPVPVGSRVRARMSIGQITQLDGALQAIMTTTIEIDGVAKPAAVIESVIRYVA